MVPLSNQWSPARNGRTELESIKAKHDIEMFEDRLKKKKRRSRKEYSIKPMPNGKRKQQKSVKIGRKKVKTPMKNTNQMPNVRPNGVTGHKISKEIVKLIHPVQNSFNENPKRISKNKSKRLKASKNSRNGKKNFKEDVPYRITNGGKKQRRSSLKLTNFPKNPKKKPKQKKLVDFHIRKEEKTRWVKKLKSTHVDAIRKFDMRMKGFLEDSPFQYYFNKILSIKPPKNDVAPLYLNDSQDVSDKPLLVVIYQGVLGFDFKDNITGVEWFLNNKVPKKATSRHIQASGGISFLKRASLIFQVVIILPKKTEFYKEIAENYVREIGEYIAGIYYVRLQNKTTKTLDIKNIIVNFSEASCKNIVYLAPINTEEGFIRSREAKPWQKLDNEEIKNCKFLAYKELWEMDRVIPMNTNHRYSKIITCLVPHLIYSKYKKSRKVKTGFLGIVEHDFEGLEVSLNNVLIGAYCEVKEFLLPDLYYKLARGFDKESLCEHHAILKLLLSQGVDNHYEDDKENFNIAFNYKKLKMFENLRDVGVTEDSMNQGLSLLRRNQKNLNNIVKYFQLGESINGKKMAIFNQLIEFSKILSVKNLDLEAIVQLAGEIYLV